jgi:dihydropyrimidinase
MPMLWTHGVGTGRLTPNEFVAVTSTNIAKILNCYPKKGAVLVGADADLVVWDPEKRKDHHRGAQQSKIDYNVFEGHKVKGLPRFTLTRGHVAIHDGECARRKAMASSWGARPRPAVNRALSQWKDLTAPRPVARSGIPATGV